MFGVKINEFDNSDGTIESFNKIFPATTLGVSLGKYVEIGEIVETKRKFESSPFVRYLNFYNADFEPLGSEPHDFGERNFFNNEDFLEADTVKFKYFAKDLDGNIIAKAYNCEELARKLGCHVSVIKRRLARAVTADSNTDNLFNVTRKEL